MIELLFVSGKLPDCVRLFGTFYFMKKYYKTVPLYHRFEAILPIRVRKMGYVVACTQEVRKKKMQQERASLNNLNSALLFRPYHPAGLFWHFSAVFIDHAHRVSFFERCRSVEEYAQHVIFYFRDRFVLQCY